MSEPARPRRRVRYWRTRPSRRSSGTGSRSLPGFSSSRGCFARSVRGGFAAGRRAGRQVVFEPGHRRAEVDAGQVHHQVDRPAAALAPLPVHELGAGDRQRALFGVPFVPVVPIADRAAGEQHGFQRHRPDRRRHAGADRRSSFRVAFSAPRPAWAASCRQFFMLITWLVSVRRLSKAPVSWLFFSSAPHSLKPRFEVISVVLVLCRFCISVKNSPTWAGSISTYPTSSITRQS